VLTFGSHFSQKFTEQVSQFKLIEVTKVLIGQSQVGSVTLFPLQIVHESYLSSQVLQR